MTKREIYISNFLKANYAQVFRNGYPDFVATLRNKVVFIEVKSKTDRLSSCQKKMHRLLKKLGLTVITLEVETRKNWQQPIKDALGIKESL